MSASEFQFLWMNDVETVNTIMMAFLSPPTLVVYETSTQLYYLVPLNNGQLVSRLDQFLERVISGDEQVNLYISPAISLFYRSYWSNLRFK